LRNPLVCGNWKMFKTPTEARKLAREIRNGRRGAPNGIEVAVFPAFPAILWRGALRTAPPSPKAP
jgi:triosephosphate isomerase